MEVLTEKIVTYCIHNEIISAEDVQWFRYGIEKRIIFLLCTSLLTALVTYLCGVQAAVSFLIGFFMLRERIGGYHAKTPLKCMSISVTMVLLSFGLLYPYLNAGAIIFLGLGSVAAIFLLAPYNHPNMHFSTEELNSLRPRGRIWAIILHLTAVLLWGIGLHTVARGLIIGITMAAFLLCLAYISDWRNRNEEGNFEPSRKRTCTEDDKKRL